MKLYKHFRDVPVAEWRWPNFSPQELASKREGELGIDEGALDKLQALRTKLGRPLLITSAYRSKAHNAAVGGATNSQHLQGKAFDVRMENQEPEAFEAAARSVGFTGFGFYPKQGFIHIDTGPSRIWGTRFAKTATALPVEPKMPPTSVAKDKQAVVSLVGAGGVLTAGGTAVSSIGALGETAQVVMIVGLFLAAAALAYIFRKRIAEVVR